MPKSPSLAYRIKFKCHLCPESEGAGEDYKYKNISTIYEMSMPDNSCHALECQHCNTPFLLQHGYEADGYGHLHAGTHSRIIHYTRV